MTKQEIIDKLVNLSGLHKEKVTLIVDNLLETIIKSAINNEKVEIRGFGAFYKAFRKERKIYSPIAKKRLDVPSKNVLAFKASKVLEEKFSEGA